MHLPSNKFDSGSSQDGVHTHHCYAFASGIFLPGSKTFSRSLKREYVDTTVAVSPQNKALVWVFLLTTA